MFFFFFKTAETMETVKEFPVFKAFERQKEISMKCTKNLKKIDLQALTTFAEHMKHITNNWFRKSL